MSISREFVLAGSAIFTVKTPDSSPGAGRHFTFRCDKVEASDRWPESYFVKLLVGSDNENDYAYLGKLDSFTGQLRTSAKSCRAANSFEVKLLNRVLARVWSGDHAAYQQHGYETMHAGRCGRCARLLTTPESLAVGIGPECQRKMAMAG
jgi:hypothetical protein